MIYGNRTSKETPPATVVSGIKLIQAEEKDTMLNPQFLEVAKLLIALLIGFAIGFAAFYPHGGAM